MQPTAIRTVADSLPGNEIIKSQVVLSRILVHVVRFFDYASTPSLLPRLSGENNAQNDRYVDSIN